jgi:hypothetical protein
MRWELKRAMNTLEAGFSRLQPWRESKHSPYGSLNAVSTLHPPRNNPSIHSNPNKPPINIPIIKEKIDKQRN